MIGRIFALIYKELLAIWRDKKSRIVLIVPPITQLLIFSLAATLDVKDVPIGILNRDNGAQSIELIERLYGSPFFTSVFFLKGNEEVASFIDNQKGAMVVHFDEQFSRNLDAKKPASVQLILDGRKSNTAQIIAGYFSIILDQFNNDFSSKIGYKLQTVQIFPRNWYNPNLLFYWYNVPSLCGILTLLEALIVTGLSVARERELGTFDQLLVSPLLPIEILIGKTIPAIIIGMIGGTVILLAGVFIFQIPFTGSFLLFYLGLFVFVCSIVGFGLFISALAQTQQQAILGTFLFMTPSVMLSGFATPVENMPVWLQYVTYLNPLKYFLVISRGEFLKNMPAEDVFANCWPMAIIAVVTLTFTAVLFRRNLA